MLRIKRWGKEIECLCKYQVFLYARLLCNGEDALTFRPRLFARTQRFQSLLAP
jgi:hypothetical protein